MKYFLLCPIYLQHPDLKHDGFFSLMWEVWVTVLVRMLCQWTKGFLCMQPVCMSLAGGDNGTVGRAAEMAIDVCLGLGREHLLWSDVVPRFANFGAARGQLLERLLPRITAGQIHSLAPEVMQVSQPFSSTFRQPPRSH